MWGVSPAEGASPRSSSDFADIPTRTSSWLGRVPGLLDAVAAPKDCLPLSSSLHRVLDGVPEEEQSPTPTMWRIKSSPAELATLKFKEQQADGQRQASTNVLLLMFLFVALDASKGFAVSWAAVHGHMCGPLVICVKNVLSITCGMVMSWLLDGDKGVRQCLDWRRSITVGPIAASFCISQVFALQAARTFDPGSLKIVAQVNLPTTALLSWMVLGQSFSAKQWVATLLLLAATMAFLQVRILFFKPHHYADDELHHPTPNKIAGMCYMLASIALSCSASILAELFLKRRYEVPFYVQKTNLMFGELLCACCMAFVKFNVNDADDVCSWEQIRDWRQLPVIIVWFTHGWIAGLLVKRCSALAKNVSHILSAMVTYFLPLLILSDSVHFLPVTLAAILVLISVLVFATVPRPPREKADSSCCKRRMGKNLTKSSSAMAIVGTKDMGKPRLVVPPEPPSPKPYSSVALLVLCFILLDATKPMLMTWAHDQKEPDEQFNHGEFVLVQTFLSLMVGLAIAIRPQMYILHHMCPGDWLIVHPEWRVRLASCLDMRAVLQQLPVSICLCLSKILLVTALSRLDAGTVRVFGQSSLPLVGVSAAVFFSKRYTLQQWFSLMAVSVALVTFYYVKAQVQLCEKGVAIPAGRRINVAGVLITIASIGFNCLGAVLVEKFLKEKRGKLHEQKSQLLFGEVLVNAIFVFVFPLFMDEAHSPYHRGFFAGWDIRVLICTLVWIPAGWTATMLVKRCSNVVKTMAQSTSGVLTYVFSVLPVSCGPRWWPTVVELFGPPLTPEPFSSPVVLLAVTVMLSALTFGMGNHAEKRQRRTTASADQKPLTDTMREMHRLGGPRVSRWVIDSSYRYLRKTPTGSNAGDVVKDIQDDKESQVGRRIAWPAWQAG